MKNIVKTVPEKFSFNPMALRPVAATGQIQDGDELIRAERVEHLRNLMINETT